MKERRVGNDWNDIRDFVQNFMVDVSFRDFRAVFIGVGQLVCKVVSEVEFNGESFGKGLRIKMAELNISVTKLSKITSVSRNTITSAKSGRTKMLQFETLNTLCKALGCTPNDLFK